MRTALNDLHQLMPPPVNPSETGGSWDDVERNLKTRLPDDYKQFIESYGSGNIGEMPITVHNPFSVEPSINLIHAGMAIFEAYQRLTQSGYEMQYPLFPEPGGLLPWGTTGNGDYLHWCTSGHPQNWHVVVWDCGETEFHSFDGMNCVQFLVGVVGARLDVFPRTFFIPTPKFIPHMCYLP